MSAIARRGDLKFVQYLLKKIGREPSPAVAQNLKRVEAIPWRRRARPYWNNSTTPDSTPRCGWW